MTPPRAQATLHAGSAPDCALPAAATRMPRTCVDTVFKNSEREGGGWRAHSRGHAVEENGPKASLVAFTDSASSRWDYCG